jgi:hypothetical protein
MEIVAAAVLIVVLAWFVSVPLRRPAGDASTARTEDPRVAELEARREALYRQIREAELDREQGKLSEADWARYDAELRREAIEVLKRLDEARGISSG